MATYAYLVDPENQFMTKSGTINVGGWLRVYDAATDDAVVTYKDFNGTENTEQIILDSNGRAVVIADSERAYRLEVYDRYGTLQWTTTPLWCMASGGGVNVHRTEVISTDGSIDIDKVTVGSTTTFDIGLAPSDSDEFLEWVKCADEDVANGIVYPTFVDGTMETQPNQGLHVGKDRFYHITASFRVYPSGTGINYESLTTELKFNDGETTSLLIRRTYDIDNSLHDSVMCEFSYDFKAPADGYLFFQLDNVAVFHDVAVVMQVHRIYSGINAVPDTCATKQWVSEYYQEKSGMSSYIPFSGINYNTSNQITGISGSAIYAELDTDTVSSIASSYAESAVSSISSWSGYFSSISSKVDQSAFDDCCSSVHSALDEKLDKSASGLFAPSGDYAYNSSVSSKLDASASGDFVLNSSFSSYSSNVGDTINNMSSSITSIENNITNISSDVSGKVDETAMSAWIPYSALDYSGTAISGIGGSSLAGMGGGGADYTGVAPVIVDNDTRLISVDHRTLCVDDTMTAYNSGSSAVLGVNVAGLDLSSKMDASASSDFYTTANESGFITGLPLNITAGNVSASGHVRARNSNGELYGNFDYAGMYFHSGTQRPYSIGIDATGSNFYIATAKNKYERIYASSIQSWNAKQDASAMTAYQPVGTYIYESALGWAEV